MTRWHMLWVAGALAAGAGSASAQFPQYGPPTNYSYMRPPALSPYLGLALGRDPAVNYFLGVRNVMDQRLNDRLLNNVIMGADRRNLPESDADLFPTLQGTGHPAAFMNYGSYFNMGSTGRPAAGTTAPRPRSR